MHRMSPTRAVGRWPAPAALKRGNGLFGSAEQTGSLGVVTINCARLGYLHAGDEAGLFAALDRLLELGKQSLETKRKLIQRLMDQGLFP